MIRVVRRVDVSSRITTSPAMMVICAQQMMGALAVNAMENPTFVKTEIHVQPTLVIQISGAFLRQIPCPVMMVMNAPLVTCV
jgi:hypothetical protein